MSAMVISTIIPGAVAAAVAYILFFVRIGLRYREDSFIVCGSITAAAFMLLMALSGIVNLDRYDFVWPMIAVFMLLLSAYTLFLGGRDIVRWAEKRSTSKRHHKASQSTRSDETLTK